MINDLDILQAIQKALKAIYPYPVYLQEVKEGFAPPAFFLKTMTVATPQRLREVYRDTDIYITYIPKKQTASTDIYRVLAAVERLFHDGFTVGDRFFAVTAMSEELIGQDNDGGQVTLTIGYYEADEKRDDAELMEILHQRYRRKETE